MQHQQPISLYFETDHDRLDDLFKNFQELKRTDYPKAKEFFKACKTGLQRHIIWEEELLFPMFEDKSGIHEGGPTHVMRLEHRQIKAALEALHEKVRRQDPESDAEEDQLLATLFMHNQKEERILYPMIDRAVSTEEREGIYREMEALPEERYQNCCGGSHHHHQHTHGRGA